MKWSIPKFRPYLEGYHFTVITDHRSLRWLHSLKEPSGRLMRWVLELQQWDFEIVHRKGAIHHVPDALSREFEEVAAFEQVTGAWYLKKLENVIQFPNKFPQWRVEEGRLYRFRRDELLDPVRHPDDG